MNRRVAFAIFVGILTVVLVVSLTSAAEKIQYQMKFKKGQKYYLRMITEQKISQTTGAQEQTVDQTTGFGWNCDVNDVDDDGNAWLKYTYNWVKLEQKSPKKEVDYDSGKKILQVPKIAEGFAALLGENFSLKLTQLGTVEKAKGLDVVRRNVAGKLSQGTMKEQLVKGIEHQLSADAMKELVEGVIAIYPDRPVGVGDSWSRTVVLSYGFPMIVDSKWTLKERKKGMAIIKVKSTVKPNLEAKPFEMGPAKVSYEMSGLQDGLIEIQESTGLILHSKVNQNISGLMKIQAVGGNQKESSWPLKIQAVTTFEMSERM